MSFGIIALGIIALFILYVIASSVRIVPQARAGVVERLGRYHKTMEPGLNFMLPIVDKSLPFVDLREQVVSFPPNAVITQDNVTVNIDTVLYFTVTDPKASTYEVANPLQAVEQLVITSLRNVIGSLTLDAALTSRDEINTQLRTVLDEATGKWGIRTARVETKELSPASSTVLASMEAEMTAERRRRAQILEAEGTKQSAILSAEGEQQASVLRAEGARQATILTAEASKQSAILSAEGDREAAATRAEGQAKAVDTIAAALANRPAEAVLAYRYIDVLPELAKGEGNSVFVVPSELTKALDGVGKRLGFGDERVDGGRPLPPQPLHSV